MARQWWDRPNLDDKVLRHATQFEITLDEHCNPQAFKKSYFTTFGQRHGEFGGLTSTLAGIFLMGFALCFMTVVFLSNNSYSVHDSDVAITGFSVGTFLAMTACSLCYLRPRYALACMTGVVSCITVGCLLTAVVISAG